MTENNSDFIQEPGIGNSADIPQEIETINSSGEDSEVKNIDNCTDSNDALDILTETMNKAEISDALDVECEEKLNLLQDHWLKLSTFFRKVYHTILDGEKPPDEYECHMDIVKELVSNDPHQLFARLEMDLQEFIIEVKLRQMELLNCIHTEEGPHLFIFCLIEGYNKLMFAANTLSPILLQLEVEHLSNFKITWRGLNQHLFHKLVFTEPKIQKVLPFCISKLGKMNSELSDFNKRLIRQFLTFDDEMTKIGGKWREAETAIIKYHQENSMLDAKERMMKINWELIKTQTKAFHDELKSSGLCDNYFSESLKKIKIEAENLENNEDQAPLSVDSFMDSNFLKSCFHGESPCLDSEILAHLNADGRKMYSHLHKFKAQREQFEEQQKQMMNGIASPQTSPNENADKHDAETSNCNGDQASTETPQSQQSRQSSQQPTSPVELHKTLIRKQQHQKKLMQMMQSSQQKDIQHKIQKQLQEHQALLQQQRKIDELQAHLLQQHPMHLDKEMQKKVHLQMQHRLMQKHKQMEEKFHQQVQHHLQHHQDKLSSTATKSSLPPKVSPSQVTVASCNYSKSVPPQKSNHKCASSVTAQTKNPTVNLNVSVSLSASVSTTKPTTTNANVGAGVTHKNSTTQTSASSTTGPNVRHHPLPDVVKSASHVCAKHTEANRNMPHNHGDHCNSSENSSDDDYSSERSNSPQRHCDCCYCEVFGSAPVSRNFQETRERLRLILTKKKAKSNSAAVNNDKPTNEQPAATQANANYPVQQTSQNVGKVKKEEVPCADKKVQPTLAEYKGDKSIEEILDFIEGNKIRNLKRTAKKMRRKQRQLEEEERRRKEEEAERLRLEEIRRKEEEEKRRIEEERRRQELNRKKNKKKNTKEKQQLNALKASQQAAAKTKTNKKQPQQQVQVNDKTKLAQNQSSKVVNQKQPGSQQTNQTQLKKGKQDQPQNKLTNKVKAQPEKLQKGAQQAGKNTTNAQKKSQNQKNGGKDDSQPQMVTIKRVMQPNSSEPTVTITLRGPTPKEDKVLYTLMNGQMCQVKDEKGKKQPPSGGNNVTIKKTTKPSPNTTSGYTISNNYNPPNPPPAALPPKSIPFNKSCSIIGNGMTNITERMERLKLSSQPVQADSSKMNSTPGASQAELTTPTAIQINQAVNQLSSRPTFPSNFDLENIKLPPGITITKVDPASVNRKPIQAKQQAPPPPPPQTHVRQSMMSSMPGSSNVIVVDTGDKSNYYQSEDQSVNGMKKKRRRRKKDHGEVPTNMPNVAQPFGATNGLPSRMGPINAGMYGNPFMNNDYRNTPQQAAAIIQMNGSMVTIRNPALHQALTGHGQQMDFHDGAKISQHNDFRNSNNDENMFQPAPEEIENDDVDEYERELEAFKRFCSQSVPAESKAKVNLNLEDIVLKKKGPVIGCS